MRRLRGRFAQTVTLWTTPGPAGLTVSSCLVADGEPGRVLGLIDDESELWTAISRSGKFAVSVLTPADQQLADRFAGLLPSPGGLFRQGDRWIDTPFGPVHGDTWVGCQLADSRQTGWSLLVEGVIDKIELGPRAEPLLHHTGSYRQLGGR